MRSHFPTLEFVTMLRRSFLVASSLLVLAPFGYAAEAPMHDAVMPVPREGGWMNRHNSFNERVKQGNVDLIFIGDSITQGWEGAGKDVWAKSYTPRHAVNLGIGGDRTQHVLWRLDNGNIEGIKPRLAVIMIGTNNSGTNTSEQIADGITAIVEKLRTKLPETKILLLGIFPRGADNSDAKRIKNNEANATVAKLADGKMITYLDIGPKFLAADGTLSKEIMPDLLHLSPAGYQIWADSIEAQVKTLMGE
ncbi:MAG: GDSL family lipase [Planctomycetales bacterium 12-60-4]|nr:MAG: GDSL family lipase [Planctomycetales bacterium 12-60-4]